MDFFTVVSFSISDNKFTWEISNMTYSCMSLGKCHWTNSNEAKRLKLTYVPQFVW